jgi:heme a synthase
MKNLQRSSRPVAIWLLVGVAMIIVQIILGGITRLTGSGLSITEWKPILGAVPPIGEAQWQAAFEKYQQIAQFKHLNFYFTLSDFKFIYFWEWFHRLWGRLIGIVFIIPFIIFLVQRRFRADMVRPMVILFLLGGVQGLIGWIMVKSGLNDENLYVSHFRLAIHFILALGLLTYTFWFALKILIKKETLTKEKGLQNFATGIIYLLVVQLVYGAFMAGLKAATFAPTWPDINGELVPSNINSFQGRQMSTLSALVNNPFAIHFIHRTLAYIITILIIIWTFKAIRAHRTGLFVTAKWLPLALVLIQVFLGIMSVLTSYKAVAHGWGVFEWMAEMHQLVAMLLLLSLVYAVYLLRGRSNTALA